MLRMADWLLRVTLLHLIIIPYLRTQETSLDDNALIYSIRNANGGTDSADVVLLQAGCTCRVTGSLERCHGRDCLRIPRNISSSVTHFRIRNTAIKTVYASDFLEYGHFVDLELDGNEISYIESGAFRNMNKLVNLSISFNHLRRLEADCFTGLESLEILRLTNNEFTRFADVIPSLVPLPRLKALKLNDNTFGRIDEDDFVPLSNSPIESLGVANCDLKRINPDSLKPLKMLRVLNLSENSMDDSNLVALLHNMKDTNLTKLNLSHLRFSGNLPSHLMEVLSRSHVAHLSLQYNVLPRLRNTSFLNMPNLRHLDLYNCGIVSIENDTFKGLTRLISLNLASNTLLEIPYAVLTLSKLERLDIRDNSGGESGGGGVELRNRLFSRMSGLLYLDLRLNRIGQIRVNSFVGLVNLKELILSNSTIYRMADGCFKPLASLRVLHLEGNIFVRQNFGVHTFEGLVSLEYLNMNSCKISHLSHGLFSSMPKLKHISLRQNAIKSLNGYNPFVDTKSLTTVDLTTNEIRGWDERLFGTSPILRSVNLDDNQVSTISEAMLEDFIQLSQVSLLNNLMDCDCDLKNLSFYFLNIDKFQLVIDTDYCYSPDYWRYKPVTQFLISDQIDCADPEEPIVIETVQVNLLPLYVIVPLFLLIIVSAIVTYLFRSYIRYCLFRWRVRKLTAAALSGERNANGERFKYDAFVSYSVEDHSFVMRMVQMLENHAPNFKLCVFERDFTAGNVLNDCILQSITFSRKVILIISENFIRSQWCLWELHLAQNSMLEENRDGMILVVIGKIKSASMPPTLRFLMRSRIYLDWDPDPVKQRLFWERLRSALG